MKPSIDALNNVEQNNLFVTRASNRIIDKWVVSDGKNTGEGEVFEVAFADYRKKNKLEDAEQNKTIDYTMIYHKLEKAGEEIMEEKLAKTESELAECIKALEAIGNATKHPYCDNHGIPYSITDSLITSAEAIANYVLAKFKPVDRLEEAEVWRSRITDYLVHHPNLTSDTINLLGDLDNFLSILLGGRDD